MSPPVDSFKQYKYPQDSLGVSSASHKKNETSTPQDEINERIFEFLREQRDQMSELREVVTGTSLGDRVERYPQASFTICIDKQKESRMNYTPWPRTLEEQVEVEKPKTRNVENDGSVDREEIKRLRNIVEQLSQELRKQRDTRPISMAPTENIGNNSAETPNLPSGPYGGNHTMYRAPGFVAMPKTSPMMNPFSYLKFKGFKDPSRPMLFLEQFEKIAQREGIRDCDKFTYFGHCLIGDASIWWNAIMPASFEPEARDCFIDRYWNHDIQMMARIELTNARYLKTDKTDIDVYASQVFNRMKYFTPPMTEGERVSRMAIAAAREMRSQ